jgi:uncharacterized membrane protein YgcG
MELIVVLGVLALAVGGGVMFVRARTAAAQQRELQDAQAEARRWVERLGGQVLNLVGSDEASKQALADAAERYNAAGSQLEQAKTARQFQLATDTALEGLYYVRAARTAMGIDPGPELPLTSAQRQAGRVTEDRTVEVEGHRYSASRNPSERTPHYYPGGMVAGRPVPQGWYSEPWWKPALVAGAWGVGSFLLFNAMFTGMYGVPAAYEAGYAEGYQDASHGGDAGAGGGDTGGDTGGDFGGGDFGGGGGFGDF